MVFVLASFISPLNNRVHLFVQTKMEFTWDKGDPMYSRTIKLGRFIFFLKERQETEKNNVLLYIHVSRCC